MFKYGVFSGPYFPAFGLNTDQKNSVFGHFSRSVCLNDKVSAIEFLTLNLIQYYLLYGKKFSWYFTDLLNNRENKFRKIFLQIKYIESLKVSHYMSKAFTNEKKNKMKKPASICFSFMFRSFGIIHGSLVCLFLAFL